MKKQRAVIIPHHAIKRRIDGVHNDHLIALFTECTDRTPDRGDDRGGVAQPFTLYRKAVMLPHPLNLRFVGAIAHDLIPEYRMKKSLLNRVDNTLRGSDVHIGDPKGLNLLGMKKLLPKGIFFGI